MNQIKLRNGAGAGKSDHEGDTKQAELFANDGQHEVRVGLGQKVQLLNAVSEPGTQPLATAKGYKRL